MQKKVAMVGFGELGRQFMGFLSDTNVSVSEVICFDDALFKKGDKNTLPFDSYIKDEFKNHDFYVALGYQHLQKKSEILNELIKLKRNLPSFVHPTSFFNKSAKHGAANFIYPMCNIDKGVKLGNGILLNNSVTISHDNSIGNGCYISPGVVTSGNVEIGENTFIGSGAVISNNVRIGKNVRIGIGSVIGTDIPDNCSVIGNPARILQKHLNII